MSQNAEVALIVPVYNTAQYLTDLYSSLSGQTNDGFIIIFIDDGSTDGSSDILSDLAQQDGRIAILSQRNKGLSAARNAGIDHLLAKKAARAIPRYTMFIDSDDCLREDAISKLLDFAHITGADDVFYSGEAFYDSDDLREQFGGFQSLYERKSQYSGVYNGRDYLALCTNRHEFKPSACMQLIKTSLLLDENIRFCEGIIHEDNLFTAQLLLRCDRVAYLNEKLYLRRVRRDSIMTQRRDMRSVEGYFRGALELIKELNLLSDDLTEAQSQGLQDYIDDLLRTATNELIKVPEDEWSSEFLSDRRGDREFFNLAIADRAKLRKEASTLRESNARLEMKLLEMNEVINTMNNSSIRDDLYREGYQAARRAFSDSISWRIGRAVTLIPRKLFKSAKFENESSI